MKVVITGGAGFLGHRLARTLLAHAFLRNRDGAPEPIEELVLFDAVEPAPIADGDDAVRAVTGDIADRALLRRVIDAGTDSVFHLAAVVSAAAEADFDLGMRANLDGTRAVLDACRALKRPPRVVFASSVAVFGGDMPKTLDDATAPSPQTSYGTQKAIGELLVADYSRKGFIDGRSLRLPTIVVRPGKPNKAASAFASGILREPLSGQDAICPVASDARLWVLSPRKVVAAFRHAHDLPTAAWEGRRSLNLPGISITVDEMVEGLRRVAGAAPVARIRWQPDPQIQRIVAGWPGRFDAKRARRLGFEADSDIDEIIRAFIDEELGGKPAA